MLRGEFKYEFGGSVLQNSSTIGVNDNSCRKINDVLFLRK